MEVESYHIANLALHIFASLMLFVILRRTFLLPSMLKRWGAAATALALAVALLWAVHPLQTESVTYVVQRAESLVGVFYLLTLYCVLRGATAPGGETRVPNSADVVSRLHLDECRGVSPQAARGRMTWWWYTAAAASCVLGMASKEVMATAPLIVMLYDVRLLDGVLPRNVAAAVGPVCRSGKHVALARLAGDFDRRSRRLGWDWRGDE